jgi:hypothetical protein
MSQGGKRTDTDMTSWMRLSRQTRSRWIELILNVQQKTDNGDRQGRSRERQEHELPRAAGTEKPRAVALSLAESGGYISRAARYAVAESGLVPRNTKVGRCMLSVSGVLGRPDKGCDREVITILHPRSLRLHRPALHDSYCFSTARSGIIDTPPKQQKHHVLSFCLDLAVSEAGG